MEYFWTDLSLTNNSSIVVGLDAVAQAVFNALHIEKFDVLFDPQGCELESLLFDPMDEITVDLIKDTLISCVERKEPRITIVHSKTSVIPNYETLNYEIHLVMKILNDDKYYSLDFVLKKL